MSFILNTRSSHTEPLGRSERVSLSGARQTGARQTCARQTGARQTGARQTGDRQTGA